MKKAGKKITKPLTALFSLIECALSKSFGAIAQLGERLHGMQEVSGTSPLSSTKSFYRVPFV